MPNQQNITIKLTAAPLAVTAGNAVKLRAETSVNAGEPWLRDAPITATCAG